MEPFKCRKSELAYKGHVIDLYTNYIEIPNGNIAEWDLIKHNGAAAIIPIKDDGKIIMVRQYRCATDGLVLEIPAGCRDGNEEFAVCAARELEEETGYRSESVHHLIDYRSAPAYTSELVAIYYADHLIPSKQNLDENEYVQLEEYTLDELIDMIMTCKISDGKTIAAILAYKNVVDSKKM